MLSSFNIHDSQRLHIGTPEAPEPLEQFLRCLIVERESETQDARKRGRRGRRRSEPLSADGQAIVELGRPYEGWCMVPDWETTRDTRQDPRFLIYHLHGLSNEQRIYRYREGRLDREALDSLFDAGLVYDSGVCTADEVETMRRWAQDHCYAFMDRRAFLDVFYRWAYHERALVIGHNLAFDLSRLALSWTQGGGAKHRDFRGGFSLKLCECPHEECFDHPRLRMRRLGRHKTTFAFAHVRIPANNANKARTRKYDGRFVDTATAALALLGPGDVRLAGLARRLKLPMGKGEAEHGKTITRDYLDYADRDVEVTWACYQKLRDLYRQHGTRRAIWNILSEASMAKAYLDELDVPRFDKERPKVSPEVIGYGMQSYYGGRTEVHWRLSPVEVELSDFKSQYPTVNALMGLQDLILARSIRVRSCVPAVRAFLASPDLLDRLQRPETWALLRCLVKVRPDGEVLPFRGRFGGKGVAAANIALCHVYGREETWYALPDLVANVLLTGGKVPEIVEALELVPRGRVKTEPFQLFGDERFTLDLNAHDFGTRLIDLRQEVIAERDQAACDADREYLDSLQRALKIVANSGCYGVLLEVNAKERTEEPKPVHVYHHEMQATRSHIVEEPGPFFAGAVGTFITAGGRLLLAIAERLAADRGISYAFCDTDSMSFARPDWMDRERFRRHVAEIRDWFTPLSPYEGKAPIFEREKENDFRGEAEPLYCLAISPKRYALYNRRPAGGYRLRKFSAHGTGSYETPSGYQSPADIPAPVDEKGRATDDEGNPIDVYKLGGPRWLYDLWYRALEQAEQTLPGERPYITVGDMPGLDVPAMHQVTVSTWNLWEQFKDIEGLRPFNFISVLPPIGNALDIANWAAAWEHDRRPGESWDDDVAAQREARNAAEKELKAARKRILDERGMRPNTTLEDQPIPRNLYRKQGLPVDVMADLFGYDNVDDFLEWLKGLEDRASNLPPRRHQTDNPYATLKPDTTFYAPFGKSMDDIRGKVRRSDTHEQVDIEHRTMADCLRGYFQHPNYKAADPRHIGPARRRHVQPAAHVFIGRETNRVLEEKVEESEGVLPYPDAEVYARSNSLEWLQEVPTGELAKALDMSKQQIRNLKNGAQPAAETRTKLEAYRQQRMAKGRAQ